MGDQGTSHFYRQAMGGIAAYVFQELSIEPGVDYLITGASDEPRLVHVQLRINPRYLRRLSNALPELALAAHLQPDHSLRLSRGPRGTLSLEIPKPDNLCFDLQVSRLPQRGRYRAAVGLDTSRRPALLNFGQGGTPHLLVAGTTGSGKTNTQHVVAWSVASHHDPNEVRLLIIDIEKRERHWGQFEDSAHLAHPVVIEEDEARRVISWLVAELDRRRTQGYSTPHLFVLIDELQSLVEAGGMAESLGRLARVGRDYNLHLVVATQHPTVEALGDPAFKRNLSARLVSRVDDANAAYIATGQRNSGAERLAGPGDSILVQPGDLRRLTIARMNARDFDRLPRTVMVPELSLDELEDPERVLDVALESATQTPDPLEPAQVAYALATGRGISHLCRQLGIGSSKAGRIKSFADEVRQALGQLGYCVRDTVEPVP